MTANANFNLFINAKPVVLVAPLDWGLGHAARCIPLIHQFLKADCEVIIAAEGQQRALLAKEFPLLTLLDLAGYRIQYGKNRKQTLIKILLQVPKILIKINRERQWLKRLVKEKHLDIVISDNRYGLHHPQVISVLVTHQLLIKSSFGQWADRQLQKLHYRFIRRFHYCWVPDAPGDDNLGGELSHPAIMPAVATRYLGVLSRIKSREPGEKSREPGVGSREKEVRSSEFGVRGSGLEVEGSARGVQGLKSENSLPRLLVLLSGPEPQRSIFEKKVVGQLNALQRPATIVRGLVKTPVPPAAGFIDVYDHLPTEQMQQAIHAADIIISRSGYSTIMDVLPLGKKCIFIPTPGQAEQEYLAAYLASKGWCCTASQNDFLLPPLLGQASRLQLPDLRHLNDGDRLQQLIRELLARL